MSTCENSESESTFKSKNYSCDAEKYQWDSLKRWSQQWKYSYNVAQNPDVYGSLKRDFRARRTYWSNRIVKKALRISLGNNDDIGALTKLTNSYFLVGGNDESENFCRVVEGDLPGIPVIPTSLGGCRIVGRMCVGNKHGLVVPDTVYDTELQHIKERLPDSIEIQKVEERLSALGNVVACNDHVALVHPELDKETEEIIANTLQVEIFRHTIGSNSLVGSYCILSNQGGLISNDIDSRFLESLSSLLDLPLFCGTVNRGNKTVGSGVVVNDSIAYAGMKTTTNEFRQMEKAFGCDTSYYIVF